MLAFVLAVLLVGWVVKGCRERPRLIEEETLPKMEEVTFKKRRPLDAPE